MHECILIICRKAKKKEKNTNRMTVHSTWHYIPGREGLGAEEWSYDTSIINLELKNRFVECRWNSWRSVYSSKVVALLSTGDHIK